MKNILVIACILFGLTSCGIKEDNKTPINPYPTLPLGATTIPMSPGEGDNYEALGTEPFWNAKITATGVTFTRPDESGVSSLSYETRQTENDGTIVVKDAKGEFFITLKRSSCSDGMSDKRYYYTANVALGAESLKGCANKD